MEKETEKINTEIEAFDLEIDTSAPKANVRVHTGPGDSACISCEG